MKSDDQGAAALSGVIRRGQFLSFGGPLVFTVTADFLVALCDALSLREENPEEALHQIGYEWGRRWLAQIAVYAEQYQVSIGELALSDVERLLQDDLSRAGWGQPSIDLESFAGAGMILITVSGGPVTALEPPTTDGIAVMQAGFFAGVFGTLTDMPMAGLGVCADGAEAPIALIAIGHEARISGLRARLEHGESWQVALADALARG
jgi:hypothetical protein